MKFALGLFERPYAMEDDQVSPGRLKEGEQLAEDLAIQSLVLLKNEGDTLPIAGETRQIALIGPLATDTSEVLGSWRFAADPARTISIEQGLRTALPAGINLKTAQGCNFDDDKRDGFAEAVELAAQSDLVILSFLVKRPA